MAADLIALLEDPVLMQQALDGADLAPLLMLVFHLTGEEAWLDEVAPFINGPWNFQENAPPELKRRLRDRLHRALLDQVASVSELPSEPPPHLLRRMLSVGVGQTVPNEYIPMILEETNGSGRLRHGVTPT